jgi:hypothetical protein
VSTLVQAGKHWLGLDQTEARRKLMQAPDQPPEELMQLVVAKHNELRARHGVAPMTWDWNLAWSAYNYVYNCPTGHSNSGNGENLAWGHQNFFHAIRDWYNEVRPGEQ